MTYNLEQRFGELVAEYQALPRWRFIRRRTVLDELLRVHEAREHARRLEYEDAVRRDAVVARAER